jgi:hypothetical protein
MSSIGVAHISPTPLAEPDRIICDEGTRSHLLLFKNIRSEISCFSIQFNKAPPHTLYIIPQDFPVPLGARKPLAQAFTAAETLQNIQPEVAKRIRASVATIAKTLLCDTAV